MVTWMYQMSLKIHFTLFLCHNLVYIPGDKEVAPKEICSSKLNDGYDTTIYSGKKKTFRSKFSFFLIPL